LVHPVPKSFQHFSSREDIMRVFTIALALCFVAFGSTDGFAQGAGKGLFFDGVDDYVTVGTPDVVAGGSNDNGLTLSAWIKAESFTVHDARIISKTSSVNEQSHYWMLSTFDDGTGVKLRFRLKTSDGGTSTLIATAGELATGIWIHVAATYDGEYMRIYMDGKEVGSMEKTGTVQTNNGIAAMIGNNPPNASSRPFHGYIDEVRILNIGLTEDQIRETMHLTTSPSDANLVAYWRFDEGSGSTTQDVSGNGWIGTLFNSPTWLVSSAPFGAGSSDRQTISSTGTTSFAPANISMDFVSKTGTDDMVVTKIDGFPGGEQPWSANSVLPTYWVIQSFGTGSFSSSITFDVGAGSISPADQADPTNIKLYWRGACSDGTWTELASATSATSSEVIFDGISTAGQFAIGTIGDSPLPIQLASFSASIVNDNSVLFQWGTLSEVNNFGFNLQRRIAGQGEFDDLPNSFVPGHGTTLVPQNYAWTHENVAPGTYEYRLKQIDLDGTMHYFDPITVVISSPTGVNDTKAPREFSLNQNYPNPFNPSTKISFAVEQSGHTTLTVYNIIGQQVAQLFNSYAETGRLYTVDFDASNLPNGTYFYKLASAERSSIKKMTLLK
jgi:hypothetical protein